jgi:fatty acid desaturase
MDKKEKQEPLVIAIAGTVCAFATGIAALVLIFARTYAWIIIFTTLVLCLFGVVMAKGHCHCGCGPDCKCNTETKNKK